jgi:pSer/pThr/pTyr-binding forkhead associated (FHA) protein
VTVHDLGSRNGTSVNGGRVSDQWLLRDGDVINVGSLLFEVRITEQAPCLSGRSNDSNEAVPLVVG